MKKKNIMIVGAMYSLNYGDGIICKTVKNIIEKKYGFNTIIFGISGKSDYPKVTNQIISNKKSIKNRISKIFPINKYIIIRSRKKLNMKLNNLNAYEYKAIVFAGGQLFMNCFIDFISEIVKWAKKNEIPVYFNCCGMGKISYFNKLKLYKSLNSNIVYGVTIRDGIKKFNDIFKYENIVQVYDPVIEVSDYYKSQQMMKNKKLGIGIIHPVNFRKNCVSINKNGYEQIIHDIVLYCKKNNIEFEFFTNGDILDYQYCNYIAEKLKCEKFMANRPNSPEELIEIIIKYQKIISCRLHSLIIAASYNIPTSAFVWDLKVHEFMKNVGREEFCIFLKQTPSYNIIENNLNLLLTQDFTYKFDKFSLSSESLQGFFKNIVEK